MRRYIRGRKNATRIETCHYPSYKSNLRKRYICNMYRINGAVYYLLGLSAKCR